jgi:hypothetical protein
MDKTVSGSWVLDPGFWVLGKKKRRKCLNWLEYEWL